MPQLNDLPEPPPANKKQLTALAGALANCIRSGMQARHLAELGFTSQGPEFVYTIAQQTSDEAYKAFETDPIAWPKLAPVQGKLRAFLADFIAANQAIVAREKIEAPAEDLRTTQCPLCFFEAPLIGFVGVCPECGADTREAIRKIRACRPRTEEPAE